MDTTACGCPEERELIAQSDCSFFSMSSTLHWPNPTRARGLWSQIETVHMGWSPKHQARWTKGESRSGESTKGIQHRWLSAPNWKLSAKDPSVFRTRESQVCLLGSQGKIPRETIVSSYNVLMKCYWLLCLIFLIEVLILGYSALHMKEDSPLFTHQMLLEYLLCAKNSAAAAAKPLQSCPTLCDPIDGSPQGSSIPGILQARTLEWVAISFSKILLLIGKITAVSGRIR